MKQFVLLFAAIVIVSLASSDANAQRLFRRIFRAPTPTIHNYQQPVQRSFSHPFASGYSYRPAVTSKTPRPVTGYGANLHRNFQIRRAQQRAAVTGIPPRNTGNILWAR